MGAIRKDDIVGSKITETEGLYPLSNNDALKNYQDRDYRTRNNSELRRICMSDDIHNTAAIVQNVSDIYGEFFSPTERVKLTRYVKSLETLANRYTLTQKDMRERNRKLAEKAIEYTNDILARYNENGWDRICTKKSLRADLKKYQEMVKANTDIE